MKRKNIIAFALFMTVILVVPATGYQAVSTVAIDTSHEREEGNITPASTNGNILYVGGSGPNNYTKIQDAINAAGDWDTVFVYSGIYEENLIISKSTNLSGEDRYNTIIEGNGTAVTVQSSGLAIKNFSIRSSGTNYNDSCIFINEGERVLVEKNIISGNRCRGISLVSSSHCTISNNILKNNSYEGISIEGGSSSNNISYNTIISGISGIYIDSSDYQTVIGNRISDCSKGVELTECSGNTVTGNNITNNMEGLFSYYATKNKIQRNNFISNERNARFARFFHVGFMAPDKWNENYWDDWMNIGGKCIFGAIYIQTFALIGIFLPWVEIDWHPAKEPYKCGVGNE